MCLLLKTLDGPDVKFIVIPFTDRYFNIVVIDLFRPCLSLHSFIFYSSTKKIWAVILCWRFWQPLQQHCSSPLHYIKPTAFLKERISSLSIDNLFFFRAVVPKVLSQSLKSSRSLPYCSYLLNELAICAQPWIKQPSSSQPFCIFLIWFTSLSAK